METAIETFDLNISVYPQAWAEAYRNGLPKRGEPAESEPESMREAIARVLRSLADEIDGTTRMLWDADNHPVFINAVPVGHMALIPISEVAV